MSEMLTKVAAALEQAFKDRVSATAGQPFESTGVIAPGFDVWEAYARAAVGAMRDVDAGWPNILAAGKKALYSCASDPELEDARNCWHAMIDESLKP